MHLKPLNDTVIIKVHENVAVDTDQAVLDVVKRGLIVLPEKNSVFKVSNRATVVVSAAKEFSEGEEIIYDQFTDRPLWHEGNRIIRTHYIQGVYVGNKLKPLGKNLIVELEEVKKATEGGIFLPEDSRKAETVGTVTAAGSCDHVKVGDRIFFGEFAGHEVIIGSKKCKIMKESEVLFIYEA